MTKVKKPHTIFCKHVFVGPCCPVNSKINEVLSVHHYSNIQVQGIPLRLWQTYKSWTISFKAITSLMLNPPKWEYGSHSSLTIKLISTVAWYCNISVNGDNEDFIYLVKWVSPPPHLPMVPRPTPLLKICCHAQTNCIQSSWSKAAEIVLVVLANYMYGQTCNELATSSSGEYPVRL